VLADVYRFVKPSCLQMILVYNVYRRLFCCFLYLGFARNLQLSWHILALSKVGLAAAVLQAPVFVVSNLQESEEEETNEPYTGPLLCLRTSSMGISGYD